MTDLKILLLMQDRLRLSQWWCMFLGYNKETLATNTGLCHLLDEIVGQGKDYTQNKRIIDTLWRHKEKFGGKYHRGYWWPMGKIRPRLKLVRFVIQEMQKINATSIPEYL